MRILQWVAVMWIALATGAVAQDGARGISVTGEGVVSMAPDMATIRLGVSERAATASDAMRQTSEKVRGILDQLDSIQVAGLDRQTSGLYLRPVYDNRPREDNGPAQVAAYEAGNTVSITVRDLSKLGALLDAVVAEGANNFNGLEFGLQDNANALIEARKGAVADAMARANQLADAAGVKLGDVLQMSESSQGYMPMEMKASQMRSMDVPIESGEVSVRAQVNMQFAIAQD
ncbi:SIMPL domain-containing protein [Sulfitobacter sp. AS59]|uniref:SIMPL domain-containing protein n=1 Tax=Sulfitobacter sp. AS59 TaxID=3135784 RepID=UPI00317FA9E8